MTTEAAQLSRFTSLPTTRIIREVPLGQSQPMAGAILIVFLCFGVICYLAGEASFFGAPGPAIIAVSVVVLLFTMIEVEFGLYCLMAGMLLSPEIRVPWVELSRRDFFIRLDDIMVMVVGIAWFATTIVRGKVARLKASPLNYPILIFTFLTALSTARGVFTGAVGHPLTAFFYVLKFTEFFLLYFLIINNIHSEAQIRRVMFAYFVTVVLVVVYATWTTIVTQEHGRATTPFETDEEPATLGGYLLFSFALAFGLLIHAESIAKRAWYFIMLVSIIPPFLYTLSRASYMAFIPMYLGIVLISSKRTFPIVLLILFAVISPLTPEATINRINYTFQERTVSVETTKNASVEVDPSSAARLERYKGVVAQWAWRPLLGQGVTGVGFVDSQVVRVLGEVGVLGLLTLIWIFKSLLQSTVNLYKSLPDGYMKGLVLGTMSGTIGLMFHAVTANTFTVVRVAGPFWAVCGLIMAVYYNVLPRLDADGQPLDPSAFDADGEPVA